MAVENHRKHEVQFCADVSKFLDRYFELHPELPFGSSDVESLPFELRQPDRRELDDAVFELLGVTDPARRSTLIDKLYEEITRHMRAIRVVEVQKMEQRRQSDRMESASVADLAHDIWNELDSEWRQPLRDWLGEHVRHGKSVVIPEGVVRLP